MDFPSEAHKHLSALLLQLPHPPAREGHGFALLKVDCHLERCYRTQVTYSQAEGKRTSLLEPGSPNLASEL